MAGKAGTDAVHKFDCYSFGIEHAKSQNTSSLLMNDRFSVIDLFMGLAIVPTQTSMDGQGAGKEISSLY